jgi:hypothetical protein
MEVIFSEQNKPFTGNIGRAWGYFIVGRKSKNGHVTYCSQRSRHNVPPDGHWLFILSCAELAHMGFKIADIRLKWEELHNALSEARHCIACRKVKENVLEKDKLTYDARDILNLKTTFGL